MRRILAGRRSLVALLLLVDCATRSITPAPATTAIDAPSTAAPIASNAPSTSESIVVDPPAPPRSPFAYANIDPTDDRVVAPPDVRPTCEDDLAAAGIAHRAAKLPVHVAKGGITCGSPQVVVYDGSPAKIAWTPGPPLLTCTMALALARFETIAQDEAQRVFGVRIAKMRHIGTYACREMNGYPGWVSEHSYANAIDVEEMVLTDGRTVNVLKDFAPKEASAPSKKSELLRSIAARAYDEETFSSVLTPFFNKQHANHFHLDLARFRSDGAHVGAIAP